MEEEKDDEAFDSRTKPRYVFQLEYDVF